MGLSTEKVYAPLLFDEGITTRSKSLWLAIILLKVRPGRILLTVKETVILVVSYIPWASCVTVILAVPAPTIRNMLLLAPTIVATLALLIEKVYAPLLFDVGTSDMSLLP